jgi:hypothetical protein
MSKLSYTVVWDSTNRASTPQVVNGQTVAVTNTISVTVRYQWIPEGWFGSYTFSSTSVSVMHY